MKLGYARVSTGDQTLGLQRQHLSQAACEMRFEEKVSGACRRRPELERLLGQLRKGDILDRLARSTRAGMTNLPLCRYERVRSPSPASSRLRALWRHCGPLGSIFGEVVI
ncbi:recombinase family protein [Aurantimonas sp. C2-6-R+9]|uniref:recombinase family protein n=1 Tax=unclassified Aurantimonas TaxID=2638230 RepID=UPI002E173F62|nr:MULTISPECIES: recombinase family protein [unclassified Aurantimonas]MEC5293658.1 recombinase family protein [Aurantimonas sp. C2-3-R2]MEC5383859.1 recombinase family protein [Aurantimonas sp. C2-6-R+9]MEC5414721.1 recombinase family protein [Aurantimonas sp. C2-4-R8]